jgi:hypothetical protein
MILRLKNNPPIDNLRDYPPELVEALRAVLAAGAPANPDPHRKNFYDVVAGDRVYYVHVAPSGKVLLLASWQNERAMAAV